MHKLLLFIQCLTFATSAAIQKYQWNEQCDTVKLSPLNVTSSTQCHRVRHVLEDLHNGVHCLVILLLLNAARPDEQGVKEAEIALFFLLFDRFPKI